MPGAAFTVGRNRRQKAQPAKKLAFPVSKMRSWVSSAVSSMAPPGFNAGSIPQARGRTGEGRGLAICPGVAFGKASRCIAVDFSPELFVSCGVQTADTLLNGYPGLKLLCSGTQKGINGNAYARFAQNLTGFFGNTRATYAAFCTTWGKQIEIARAALYN